MIWPALSLLFDSQGLVANHNSSIPFTPSIFLQIKTSTKKKMDIANKKLETMASSEREQGLRKEGDFFLVNAFC